MTGNKVKLNDRKLMIALPLYDGRLNVQAAFNIINLCALAGKYNFSIDLAHISFCSILPKARNVMVRRFMESDCTDLLFLDSDVTFTCDDIVRLLAVSTNRDVVGGVYPRKKADKNLIATVIFDRNANPIYDENGLIEAECIPTGFMMIRRHVLEKLIANHPEWDYYDEEGQEDEKRVKHNAVFDFSIQDGLYFGEDYTFCKRVRAEGMRVHIDPALEIGHYGSIELKNNVAEALIKPLQEKVRRETQK
jgi:hypothetical protein